jgi:ABC-type proline/glycine betaine transport system permease subunit
MARLKRLNAVTLEVLAGLLGAGTLGFALAALAASRRNLPPCLIFGSMLFVLFLLTILCSQLMRRDARRLEAMTPRELRESGK